MSEAESLDSGDWPAWIRDPVRQRATLAMNTRNGKPTVNICCGYQYRKGYCSKPLGGVWRTTHGTVIVLNRLMAPESVHQYNQVAAQPELRRRLWREGGSYIELAPFIRFDGTWHRVPGEEGEDLVRCVRHGAWPLDLESLASRVELAIATRHRLQYPTKRAE